MAVVLDTNILLYAVNTACHEHSPCRNYLEHLFSSRETVFIPDNVLYEFLRVSTHARVFQNPLTSQKASSFVDHLLSQQDVSLLSATKDHWNSLRQLLDELGSPSGNFFFDIHTAALMREHGIRQIATADADFSKIKGLIVHNPLVSQ